jgi:hypothetical protein
MHAYYFFEKTQRSVEGTIPLTNQQLADLKHFRSEGLRYEVARLTWCSREEVI